MFTMKHFLKTTLIVLPAILLLTNCTKEDDVTSKGTVNFEITDGPTDDPNVKGAFVTVTEVRVDGKAISNFSGKQTIDLMAYQNGETKALGLAELKSGTYSNVELVLDYQKDANGNSPGCYVLTTDNAKHALNATSQNTGVVKINSGNFEVQENSTTNVVLDFDLRKCIRYQEKPTTNDQYDFVTEGEMNASLRLIAKAKAGKISGNVQDNAGIAGSKIIVYAYKKGQFNKSTEVKGQGASNITFKNAVTSATVNGQGNYTLAFMEEGDYELHFFGYEDKDKDGKLEIKGELVLNIVGGVGLNLNNLNVKANSTISASVLVTGIIP